jgi:hypothetical protein
MGRLPCRRGAAVERRGKGGADRQQDRGRCRVNGEDNDRNRNGGDGRRRRKQQRAQRACRVIRVRAVVLLDSEIGCEQQKRRQRNDGPSSSPVNPPPVWMILQDHDAKTGTVRESSRILWLQQRKRKVARGLFSVIYLFEIALVLRMYSSMATAAFLPAPIAKMTVAAPLTISPPA